MAGFASGRPHPPGARSAITAAFSVAPEAHVIIETPPGGEAQVDYGAGPMARDPHTGRYRRTRLFVLTPGYSRGRAQARYLRSHAPLNRDKDSIRFHASHCAGRSRKPKGHPIIRPLPGILRGLCVGGTSVN